jgi:hypothetical protein
MEYFNIFKDNLIRISIFATQFTSNWLTDNRIIGIHCPVPFCAGVNFVTCLQSTAARWLISRTHDSKCSVADPGCLSRSGMFIPDPTFFHPGPDLSSSQIPNPHLTILTPKQPKKWFLSSRKYDPGCSSRIRMLTFYPSRIPDTGVQKARIPDPQHCKKAL